jgi:hypothetical protein
MADDSRQRPSRSNDPYRRAAEPARPNEGGGDPLAELARLIGQNDPFAEFGRSNARAPEPSQQHYRQDDYAQGGHYQQSAQEPQQDWGREPSYDQQQYADDHGRQNYASQDYGRQGYSQQGYAQQDYGRQDQDYADQDYGRQDYARQDYAHPEDYRQEPTFGANFLPGHDARAEGRHAEAARLAPDQHYAEQRYADQHYDSPQYADASHAADQYAAGAPYADPRRAEPHAEREWAEQGGDHRAADAAHDDDDYRYQDDAPLDPRDDEMYDDAPGAHRRGGLATALALVGCAMLGTAGAYAYRSYVSAPGSMQPPPVITADTSTPTKIVPTNAGDPQASKAVQDRLANAGKEQIISKQEEPVALRELGTQATPRVVLPAPVPVGGSGQAAGSTGGASPAGTEPKRVRTVTIRPDGTDTSGRPVGALPSPTQAPATTRAAPSPPPPAPRAAAPAANGTSPISLDPQPSEAPKTRTAATTSTSGGYVVQLSSQKSEAEAQASFKSLQAKFPNELGDREPLIRRADLGSKGVFYRTMVGPFASAQEASQFCASYKAAGGQCVVPSSSSN